MIDYLVNVPENIIITHAFAVVDITVFAIVNEPIDVQPVASDSPVAQLPRSKMVLELTEIPHFSPPNGLRGLCDCFWGIKNIPLVHFKGSGVWVGLSVY